MSQPLGVRLYIVSNQMRLSGFRMSAWPFGALSQTCFSGLAKYAPYITPVLLAPSVNLQKVWIRVRGLLIIYTSNVTEHRILGRLQKDRPGKPNQAPWAEHQLSPNALSVSGLVDESSLAEAGNSRTVCTKHSGRYIHMHIRPGVRALLTIYTSGIRSNPYTR